MILFGKWLFKLLTEERAGKLFLKESTYEAHCLGFIENLGTQSFGLA
jgi:hypothetical protein